MSKTAELVFQNVSIVHPTGVEVGDVAIAAGLIVGVGSGLTGKKVIDATGLHLSSGFVDLHTHLREPGKEES